MIARKSTSLTPSAKEKKIKVMTCYLYHGVLFHVTNKVIANIIAF